MFQGKATTTFLKKLCAYIWCVFVCSCLLPWPAAIAADTSIGVLAKRGNLKTMQRWQPVADYLTEQIPNHKFVIYPLDFSAIDAAVESKRIDFLLVNPGIYVQLQATAKISRIVTLKNDANGSPATSFGSLIFTKAGNTEINSIEDAVGKRVAAVNKQSFGGWITAWHEFHKHGIDPFTHFERLDFLGTHDAVIMSVINGTYDIGIARTDTLERLANERQISTNDIHVIHEACPTTAKNPNELPCDIRRSTPLYPEWPLARLPSTPRDLAEKVAVALISMPEDHPAAQKANIKGWTIPANYQPVHDVLRDLRLPPYDNLGDISLHELWDSFKLETMSMLVLMLVLAVLLLRNISLNRHLRASRERLRHMARYDALTNLPNRRYFEEFASKHLYQAERNSTQMGLLFVDLDGFKPINDTYGHAVGDLVLIEVAERLSGIVRRGDIVARCGGDEFLILMVDVHGRKDLQDAATRVLHDVQKPMQISDIAITIGTSIGIACYPDDGTNVEDLLRNSDAAMYAVKQAGRNDYAFYDSARHIPIMD